MNEVINEKINNEDAVDLINEYLQEIGRYKLLTKEEEEAFARVAATGDKRAREALINHNLRLVISIAKEYRGQGLPFLDLIQEGNLGLIKAAEKYDLTKGYRFSTYATYWIKQTIGRGIFNHARNIKIPEHVIILMNNVKKVEQDFQQKHRRLPQDQEIAEILKVSTQKVKMAHSLMKDTASLDIVVGATEENTLGSYIEDELSELPFATITTGSCEDAVEKVLNTLAAREKEVIMRRFGIAPYNAETLDKVGEALKLSKESVRQIEISALKKLRNPTRANLLKDFL